MRKEFEASGKTLAEAIDNAYALAGASAENVEIEVINMEQRGFLGLGHKDARVRAIVDTDEQPEKAAKPAKERSPRPAQEPRERKEPREAKEPKEAREPREQRPAKEAREARPERPQEQQRAPKPKGERSRSEARPDKAKDSAPRKRRERGPREERPSGPSSRSNYTDISPGEMEQAVVQEAMLFLQPIFAQFKCEPQSNSQVRDGILLLSFTGNNLGILIGRRGETLNALQYLTNLAINRNREDHVRISLDIEGYRSSREDTLVALANKMAEKVARTNKRVELEPMNPHERRIVHIALQEDSRVETTSHGEEPYRRVVIRKRRAAAGSEESAFSAQAPLAAPEQQPEQPAPENLMAETPQAQPAPAPQVEVIDFSAIVEALEKQD